jgi:hypothetical protein
VHDGPPVIPSQGSHEVPRDESRDLAPILSVCTLNALLYNSLSSAVSMSIARLLAPVFVGSDYDLTAQVHLLHYYAVRMALAFVSGVPLYDARHQIFGRLHLEHILLSPTSAIWFSHSLACAEIWDSLRAVLLAHSESVQDIMCSFPPSWVHTTPLSSTSSSMECARHPLHVCQSPSIWWEEDIDKERCKLKVAHQHVGHTLRLTAREWTLELLQVSSLVLVNKEWTQPILDEWCSNPLILQDPMCPHSSCRCHRGPSKFCSWRCSRQTSGYQGCVKRNHPRFHDHFKFYMVNSATELLPKYCTGISVVSSPKFKGVPPYTLMEFRPHIGFVVAPTPSLSSAAPEPSPPPEYRHIGIRQTEYRSILWCLPLPPRDVVDQRLASP